MVTANVGGVVRLIGERASQSDASSDLYRAAAALGPATEISPATTGETAALVEAGLRHGGIPGKLRCRPTAGADTFAGSGGASGCLKELSISADGYRYDASNG